MKKRIEHPKSQVIFNPNEQLFKTY